MALCNRIPCNDPKLPGIKKVNVSLNNEKERYEININKLRLGQKKKFRKDVLDSYYKVPFGTLTMRQRRIQMSEIGKTILAACIDREKFRKNASMYIEGNKKLGIEILNLLDGVKEFLESKLRIRLDEIQDEPMCPIENDEDGLIEVLDEKKKQHNLAIALLGETGRNGYERMRGSLDEFTALPSFHTLTKNRPKVNQLEVSILHPFDCNENDNANLVIEDPLMLAMPLTVEGEDELDIA